MKLPSKAATVAASMALVIPISLTAQEKAEMTKIRFITGEAVLTATLDDTAPARDFASMLPLDITLEDYHGTELVADLGRKLDATGMPPSYEPKAGDITQYAPWSNLAIFYKPFADSRGLVRLGEFDDDVNQLVQDGALNVRIEVVD